MSKALKILGALSLVVAVLAYPAAMIIGMTATEAYMIAGKDPAAVQVEKELFEPPKGVSKDSKEYRDAVLRIYGVPTDETTPIVFEAPGKFIRPDLLPSITILQVYKEKGENPWQLKTIYFLAMRVAAGAAVVGVLLLVAGFLLRKKQVPAAPPAA